MIFGGAAHLEIACQVNIIRQVQPGLAAPAAEALAQEFGIPLCAPVELLGQRDAGGWAPPLPADTVGAVALDAQGNLAVATSTGGTPDKWPGRVGDSPLVGCGAYADNHHGAAAATGSGEMLMRIVPSKMACDLLAAGMPAMEAARAVIHYLRERAEGYGGLILLDREGNVGLAHNTPNMAYAYVMPEGEIVAGAEVADAE